MSDFDKEAEREKLREKYERDKKEREATQRMSDLLLKGATMTNSHCGTCGDPLFQQDGTTFCPSCHGTPDAVEGTDLEAQPAEQPPAETGPSDAAGDGPTEETDGANAGSTADPPYGSATIELEDRGDEPVTSSRSTEEGPSDDRSADQATPRGGDEAVRSSKTETGSGRSPPRSSETTTRRSSSTPPAVDGDLETARDSLVRALEKFAREAAETDDPRYATECLEAAREASETLNTLR
ncbi:Sjogren's syndrome/scleroderma autoantigen 1 family protein [Natrarchaeobius chitinivorans]|uniref:Uncharacterized protein n=1 Tax=Natrarchaeobius chitinivorans TaxID=1679083 RepID=A0A3N6M450_NATCH|nr:Sjogren's syndrome/scleroderma autoantigen 1 family protein [Natrarchaeobius chitinivorans]RQG95244.1 hypothetical protein EA473_09035 [Natrarchaeobius chitinivorans]